MRWFTRQWAEGELDEITSASVPDEYQAHLAVLLPTLSSSLRRLAEFNLHDARFKNVTFDPSRKHITMNLIGGDLQRGYSELRIKFENASLSSLTSTELRDIVMNPETEVLYDELDRVGNESFEQRFLLWPRGEFEIRFSTIDLELTPCTSDEYQEAKASFETR